MEFWEALQLQLTEHSFFPVRGQEGKIFWRMENPILYLICLRRQEEGTPSDTSFCDFAKSMEKQLKDFHCTRLVALTILVDNSLHPTPVETVEKMETYDDEKIYHIQWRFFPQSGSLLAGEGQPDRLIGIEKLLQAAAQGKIPERLPLKEETAKEMPWITAGIFLICLFALLWMIFSGRREEIIAAYGLSRQGIAQGEYYRLLTSVFLHGSWIHLISNSVYLYYFGVRTEQLLGKGRYLLLFLISGFCGDIFSLFLGDGWLSIGASGAIYGLMGAMLLLTKKRGALYTGMNYATILLLALTALGFGFLEEGVDNFAHIGGFLGGILLFGLFLRKSPRESEAVHK